MLKQTSAYLKLYTMEAKPWELKWTILDLISCQEGQNSGDMEVGFYHIILPI